MGDTSFERNLANYQNYANGVDNKTEVQHDTNNYSDEKPDSTDQNYDQINDDIADFGSGGQISD